LSPNIAQEFLLETSVPKRIITEHKPHTLSPLGDNRRNQPTISLIVTPPTRLLCLIQGYETLIVPTSLIRSNYLWISNLFRCFSLSIESLNPST
jgi:hypothetical protein